VDYATRGTTADHSPATHGVWHVEAFLSWLDYCEQVVSSAQEVGYSSSKCVEGEGSFSGQLVPGQGSPEATNEHAYVQHMYVICKK